MTRWTPCVPLICATLLSGCAAGSLDSAAAPIAAGDDPVLTISSAGGITLGDPIALTLGLEGHLYVADGSLGRVLRVAQSGDDAMEFQHPAQSSSFYPVDVKRSGFIIYALDMAGRKILRYDRTGTYLDVLISFDDAFGGRRISPAGLDIDPSGRIAVADAQNHVVLLFDSYLQVELVFGSYGVAPGRLNSPEGVSFMADGRLLVCDSGNARLQLFDSGGSYLRTVPPNSDSPLRRPRRADVDSKGRIYVADPAAGRVFVFAGDGSLIRQITPAGAREFRPMDVAVAPSGTIYVADSATGSLYAFR